MGKFSYLLNYRFVSECDCDDEICTLPHGECACGNSKVRNHNGECVDCDPTYSKYKLINSYSSWKHYEKGASTQRSGKGSIRKQKIEVGKTGTYTM